VGVDELHDQRDGRSSSAGKKAEAAFKMAFARLSSAFSRFNRLSSSDSSLLAPGRSPPSTSACRHHLRTVSGVPIPSDREECKGKGASDHAPVVVDLAD
jgi:hypothetical protein